MTELISFAEEKASPDSFISIPIRRSVHRAIGSRSDR
jgi:hypothetical protein